MKSKSGTARIVGAYAAQPTDLKDRHAYLDAILAQPDIDGLEMSWGSPSWQDDLPILQGIFGSSAKAGRHVLTLIGAQAQQVAQNGAFGLASANEDGRRAAIDLVRSVHADLSRFLDQGQHIVAVEIHSYPSVPAENAKESQKALRQSLAEILDWEWGTTCVVVEHCDARNGDYPWQKGLLPLELEMEVVAELAQSGRPVSMAVNWGRSALEQRDADAPARHARTLKDAGLLAGIMFSGAASKDSAYGPAWADVHPPLNDDLPESAMTRKHIATLAELAGDTLLFDGVKVAIRPVDATVEQRLRIVRNTLAAMPPGRI
ncbi:DUF4862 family protein [Rhizobium sp.]|uniref:DUF4862 family protein n=1 Tax=Rhizobium sp. TaxID=391 RepID=UPI0028A732FE